MTPFQLLYALHINKQVTTELFLSRLQELKEGKLKELQEIEDAIRFNSPVVGSVPNKPEPLYKVGETVSYKGVNIRILDVKYSVGCGDYIYFTNNSGSDAYIRQRFLSKPIYSMDL